MVDEHARERVGRVVKNARTALRLSKEEAARQAGMSSISWKRVEDGLGVREPTYSGVEQVLGWRVGEIQLMLVDAEHDPAPAERPKSSLVAPLSRIDVASTQPVELYEMLEAIHRDHGRDAAIGALALMLRQLRPVSTVTGSDGDGRAPMHP